MLKYNEITRDKRSREISVPNILAAPKVQKIA